MATTARTRRQTTAAADTPAPSSKPAAKKKAATAEPVAGRAAAKKKAVATPPPATAKPATAKQAIAKPAAKKVAAKKKAAVKAPIQQELVLEEPGSRGASKKASAKTAKVGRVAATPSPAPASPAARQPASKQPAAKQAVAKKASARQPVAKQAAARPERSDAAPVPMPAPAKPALDKPAKKAAAKSLAGKAPASKTAPVKTAASKTAANKAPAKKAAATGKKTTAGKRDADRTAPAAAAQRDVTADDLHSAQPDLLSALVEPADAVPAGITEAAPQAAPAPEPEPEAAAEAAPPASPTVDEPAAAASSAPPHSSVQVVEQNQQRRLQWQPGQTCPRALDKAARARLDDSGYLDPSDDAALPTLLHLAAEAGHPIEVSPAVWQQLAADRDARHRLQRLEAAYPEGPSSPALQALLQTTLPAYQAEGALFAVVAGRALIADERGLGKRVQAIAAASLWRRHFGVQRVLVLCTPSQRAAWQHAWTRLAGSTLTAPPQVIEGPMHQRQAMWSAAADVRILAPEALDSDAAHIADWAPELLIIDEPQQLSGWQALQAPHALVLCGAPLAGPPALLQAIVEWLDVHRQGALQAVLRIQQARSEGLTLTNDELERLDNSLSRLMLQRLRSEVQDQLPPSVHSERLVPLAPPQRDAHERLRMQVQRLLAGWQRCGYLSDADQWQLSAALRALPQACHRSQPGDAGSGLAEASIAALQAQLDDWAATGTERVAVVCATPADQAQLSERLRFSGALQWLAAGDAPAAQAEVVLQVGVPWQAPPQQANGAAKPQGHAAAAGSGQQWVYLAAQDSLEQGLIDTLLWRRDTPCGPAEQAGGGFLHGQRLTDWLQAWTRALQAARTAA